MVELFLTSNMRLDHGQNVTFLVQSPNKLGFVDKVSLRVLNMLN
jgi:hypothetical protein